MILNADPTKEKCYIVRNGKLIDIRSNTEVSDKQLPTALGVQSVSTILERATAHKLLPESQPFSAPRGVPVMQQVELSTEHDTWC